MLSFLLKIGHSYELVKFVVWKEGVKMNSEKAKVQEPISEQKIFKIMLWIAFPVSGVFLLKNIFAGAFAGILAVSITMLVFGGVLIGMRILKVSDTYSQFIVSIGLAFVVFVISANSGSYYSDDFPLFLAVIAMTALYFRPKYTIPQIIVCDVLLATLYILHPEKAESLSQFIMCEAIFTLAGFLIFLVINRGRAYIAVSENRAREAEKLLESLTQLSGELQVNFENSNSSIEKLRETRQHLDANTAVLKQGSLEIMDETHNMVLTCEDVKEKVHVTGKQVTALTEGVHGVENALAANQQNIEEMSQQIMSIRKATGQVHEVFKELELHMQEISEVTRQLDSISSSTTMLALNASIEAARAGKEGAGFAVVASKVRDLAVDSTECSGQVAGVVNQMQLQIDETTNQLSESDKIIETSLSALKDLQNGFDRLTEQFGALYQNIESQNQNVSEVDVIFAQLRNKIDEVSQCTEQNQSSVESISEAISVYREGVEKIMEDSKRVHDLSADMIEMSGLE